jgi:hypothetical protein
MPHPFFRASVLALAPLLGLVAGCGGGGATAGDLDHLQVTLSRFEVSVTNTSGHVLTDVVAEIEPVGPGTHFVVRTYRLGNGETRSWPHSSFTDGDSVPFSPRNKKAKLVIVTAKDLDGRTLRVEVPFKS